jgi:hypothetical protein
VPQFKHISVLYGLLGALCLAPACADAPPPAARFAGSSVNPAPLLFATYDARSEFAATGMLMLWLRRPAQYVRCTGTLVAPDKVLTEASCMPEDRWRLQHGLFVAAARPLPLGRALRRRIVDYVRHPDYIGQPIVGSADPYQLREANLAVLQLEAPIEGLSPAPLAALRTPRPDAAAGEEPLRPGLEEALGPELRVVSYAEHQPAQELGRTTNERMVGWVRAYLFTPWMIYAEHSLFTSGAITLYDGGSSLWQRDAQNSWQVVGIRAGKSDLLPNPEVNGAFVRLEPYLSWLQQQLAGPQGLQP